MDLPEAPARSRKKLFSNLRWLIVLVSTVVFVYTHQPALDINNSKSTFQCAVSPESFMILKGVYTAADKSLTRDDTRKIMAECNLPIFNQSGIQDFKDQAKQKGFNDKQVSDFITQQENARLDQLKLNPPFKLNLVYTRGLSYWMRLVLTILDTLIVSTVVFTALKNVLLHLMTGQKMSLKSLFRL